MAISQERRAWIEKVADGGAFDGVSDEAFEALTEDDIDRASREFFASVTDPEELHVFAAAYNWEGGTRDLWRVVGHPMCDFGTAMLVYWRAQPGYLLQYADRDAMPEYKREDWDLLREIERRVADGAFATADQPFNPANDDGCDLRPKRHEVERLGRDLPAFMYRAVSASDVR